MKLNHGLHLAYCTNIHRGESWGETFVALQTHTRAVRDRVCQREPFAIGLRLSNQAAAELGDAKKLLEFQRWLRVHHQRLSLRPVSRHVRQGTGVSPRLDYAGTRGLHQPFV